MLPFLWATSSFQKNPKTASKSGPMERHFLPCSNDGLEKVVLKRISKRKFCCKKFKEIGKMSNFLN